MLIIILKLTNLLPAGLEVEEVSAAAGAQKPLEEMSKMGYLLEK